MRVLIFTNHFYPENFRVNDVAAELVKRGCKVTVVTGIPNYPAGVFYAGYSLFRKRKEKYQGADIVRLPLIPRGKGGRLRLAFNYASYFFSSCLYSFKLALTSKFDVVFVHETSPAIIGVPALVYGSLRNAPVFFWVLDLWPESVQAAGNISSKQVMALLERLIKAIYARCHKILISSKGFHKSINAKVDVADKLYYFPNWAEDAFLERVSREDAVVKLSNIRLPDGFIIMYAGNLGEAQNFETILEAACLTRQNKRLNWVLVGDGRKRGEIERFVRERDLHETVHLLGNHSMSQMPAFFSLADVMLVSLKDELIFSLTVPAKLQAYMASGKPVLGVLDGEGASLISEAGCGMVCKPGASSSLASAAQSFFEMPREELRRLGENAYSFYQNNFGKQKNIDRLTDMFRQAV